MEAGSLSFDFYRQTVEQGPRMAVQAILIRLEVSFWGGCYSARRMKRINYRGTMVGNLYCTPYNAGRSCHKGIDPRMWTMSSNRRDQVSWSLIEDWIRLGRKLSADPSDSGAAWSDIREFLTEGERRLLFDRKKVLRLVRSSSRKFRPLQDPLQVKFGTHKWLAGEREESYSNWLKWILEQIADPYLIGTVVGVTDNGLRRLSGDIRIRREDGIKDHEGNQRRTDLDISFGGVQTFRIEVKKGDAGSVRLGQLEAQERGRDFQHYRLIVASGQISQYERGARARSYRRRAFEVCYWSDICRQLRGLVARKRQKVGLSTVVKAMILGFVGAVEQNLLGLPGNIDELTKNEWIPFSVQAYLKENP